MTIDIAVFGPFRLITAERLLQKGNEVVILSSRALDILVTLVERSGEVVSQYELMARAWPNVVVEEANLRVHIASLRKALGDAQNGARYITNIPGRGYCFVAAVQHTAAVQAAVPTVVDGALTGSSHTLPARLVRMIGRNQLVAELSALLILRRFVSVVGPGGMGKTTVAVAVAYALLNDFGDAVFFVDLGALTDAALIPATVATALGFSSQAQDPLPSLLAFLGDKRILLLLDNCEHVIEAVAALTQRLYRDAPQVHILATSRESLRVEGEYVHRLLPLEIPSESPQLTAAEALASPAVQLFMERAVAGGYRFELCDLNAPVVAKICRRLDGIALAIELAASRVGTYGIQGTADLLTNRFGLLWKGQRDALPRHQTLHAMLDWSYHFLSERERQVFCRLSVFVGVFTLDGAQAVAGGIDMERQDVADAVASLVDKSLIWVSVIDRTTYHRLLDTTSTFASIKLAKSGEVNLVARHHALYYANSLRQEVIEASVLGDRALSFFSPQMGNIRAALEWSFSGMGDAAVGVDLAAGSAPLFLGLSLLGEAYQWCAKGLAMLDEEDRGGKRELALQETLAISAMFTRGNSDEVRAAIERGLYLAEALGEVWHQVHLLVGLHIFYARVGNFREAVNVAERSMLVSRKSDESGAIVMADGMLACSYHLVGDQEKAQRYCELALKLAAVSGQLPIEFFGYDPRARALIVLGRVLWLRGFPDRAVQFAFEAIDVAERRGHPGNLCFAMVYTADIFLWRGDFDEAEKRIEQLVGLAVKHSLGPYHAIGFALKGALAIARGAAAAGIALLRDALPILHAENQGVLTTAFYRALAEGLVESGKVDEAADMIDEALMLAEQRGGTFDMPELLRVKGDILLAAQPSNAAVVEAVLLQSLECARLQSSPALALRAAMGLAKLWLSQARYDEAREIFLDVYQRFTEGFDTIDLKAAKGLFDLLEDIATSSSKKTINQ
jgi:predicted ATPase/DNA-binding winged helix-turn-helix (wHTH) protein